MKKEIREKLPGSKKTRLQNTYSQNYLDYPSKKKRFMEMAGVRLGIAALTFVIGFFIRAYFGIEIIKHVP